MRARLRTRRTLLAASIAFMASAAPALAQPDWGTAYNVTHDRSAAYCYQIDYPCRGHRYYDSGTVGNDLWFKWAWRSPSDCPGRSAVWRLQINDNYDIVSWTFSGCV